MTVVPTKPPRARTQATVPTAIGQRRPALRLRDVRKRYGRREALRGLSFEAPQGAITGLIGPNGAGKTTCFSIVGGFLLPDGGEVDVLGAGPYRPRAARGQLGMLPQDSELPPHARLDLFLRYVARLQGLSARDAERETDRVLAAVSLSDRHSARVRELSHGMRRRVSVAQALLGRPPLILLDEPTSGLDPQLVADMRELLRAQQREFGASLVVSSHVLSDLEVLCDHVVFMDGGRCTRSGSLAEVTGQTRSVRFWLQHPPNLSQLATDADPARYQGNVLVVPIPADGDPTEVTERWLRRLLACGAGVQEVRRGDSLEAAFLNEQRAPGETP